MILLTWSPTPGSQFAILQCPLIFLRSLLLNFSFPCITPPSSHTYCDSLLEENCYWFAWHCIHHPLFLLSNKEGLCLQSQPEPSGLLLPLPQLPTLIPLSWFSSLSFLFSLLLLLFCSSPSFPLSPSLLPSLSTSPFNSLACLLPPSFHLSFSPSIFLPFHSLPSFLPSYFLPSHFSSLVPSLCSLPPCLPAYLPIQLERQDSHTLPPKSPVAVHQQSVMKAGTHLHRLLPVTPSFPLQSLLNLSSATDGLANCGFLKRWLQPESSATWNLFSACLLINPII